MKQLIIFVILFISIITNSHAQMTPEAQAAELAQKMKDTLSLTEQQKSQIQTATTTIQGTKSGLRQLYVGRALDYYLMMAEEDRDAVYKNILPEDKYSLYKQKRSTLLSSF